MDFAIKQTARDFFALPSRGWLRKRITCHGFHAEVVLAKRCWTPQISVTRGGRLKLAILLKILNSRNPSGRAIIYFTSSAGAGIRPLGYPPLKQVQGPGGRSALRTRAGSVGRSPACSWGRGAAMAESDWAKSNQRK
jgi:hypothetical protein